MNAQIQLCKTKSIFILFKINAKAKPAVVGRESVGNAQRITQEG